MENHVNLLLLLNLTNIFVVLKSKKIKKKTIWSLKWLLRRNSGRDITHLLFSELLVEDVSSFQNFTRMQKNTFMNLLNKVRPLIEKQDTYFRQAIPASTRLLITLRYLATGSTFRDLSYSFRVCVPAISQIIPTTLKAICTVLKDDYLKIPTTEEEWKKVAAEFEKQWNFPHCLGALDGKHIAFKARKKDGSFYFNYKGFNSIILLALVDANYCFLYVDVGCNGRVNDAGVYSNSTLCKGIQEKMFNFPSEEEIPNADGKFPYVIISDQAFRLSEIILKPYGLRSSTENKIFNYRLSRARRVVENAFGILANKFQILQNDINLTVDKVELITMTSCILHNYIRKNDGKKYVAEADYENTTNITISLGNWRKNVFVTRLQRPVGNRSANTALEVRDQFSNYFNTVGYVPWQWEAVKKFNF